MPRARGEDPESLAELKATLKGYKGLLERQAAVLTPPRDLEEVRQLTNNLAARQQASENLRWVAWKEENGSGTNSRFPALDATLGQPIVDAWNELEKQLPADLPNLACAQYLVEVHRYRAKLYFQGTANGG